MNGKTTHKISIIPQARLPLPADEALLIAMLNDIKRDAKRLEQTGQEFSKRYGKR